jgi:hypothetical protein
MTTVLTEEEKFDLVFEKSGKLVYNLATRAETEEYMIMLLDLDLIDRSTYDEYRNSNSPDAEARSAMRVALFCDVGKGN